ncbi:MAG: condensation domain-containing protein [Pirellulales bacterium]
MSVFPLPLNAIEHYMLADDTADYPRLFWLTLRLRIQLDEARLRQAIDAATARHPLLRANVEYDGGRPRRWIECREPRYWLRLLDAVDDTERVVEAIDLRREPGVRFRVERGELGDTLACEFHHATTDGIGAMQFVRDLLAMYVADSAETSADLPALDSTRLATRNSFGLTGWRRPLRWLYGTFGWLGAIEYLVHHPAPLGTLQAPNDPFGRRSGFCSRTLTEDDTRRIVEAAKSEGVTVNDRLIRDIFTATQAFIERHAPESRRRHQRIMVPTNLRAAGDECLPAANVVAMVNIDRRPHRWQNKSQMLWMLHRELDVVKRLRLGIVFVQILGALDWLFGSLRRFLPTDRCQATCVASNLGVLPEFSNDVVQAVEFYPPIRPLTASAFGAVTFGRRFGISLHYDASAFTTVEAEELLERLMEELR